MDGAIARFAHDLRGSLGSISMNVDAALGDLRDPAFLSSVLLRADQEVRRLAACVPSIELLALASSTSDGATSLPAVVIDASIRIAERGVQVRVVSSDDSVAAFGCSREDAVRSIVALLALAAGPDGTTEVTVKDGSCRVVRRDAWPMADHLVEVIATRMDAIATIEPAVLELRVTPG
jgi:N-acyl-D-aspartate/D-glutamate deacylase